MCLATDPSRSRAVGEVVIARRPAQVAQDVSICSPYRVQAQESELSRRERFGVVSGTLEVHASLTSCI